MKAREEHKMDQIEAWLENRIFNCRFLTLMAVVGSLVGATLCFIKGSIFVAESVKVFVHHCIKGLNTGKVIMLLVEALDVYLIGTVMLIFGMGLYELFVDTLILPDGAVASSLLRSRSSSLFGLFPLRARPKWLEISSLDEMKTKLGHVSTGPHLILTHPIPFLVTLPRHGFGCPLPMGLAQGAEFEPLCT